MCNMPSSTPQGSENGALNPVEQCKPVKRTIQIGIFFDGTSANKEYHDAFKQNNQRLKIEYENALMAKNTAEENYKRAEQNLYDAKKVFTVNTETGGYEDSQSYGGFGYSQTWVTVTTEEQKECDKCKRQLDESKKNLQKKEEALFAITEGPTNIRELYNLYNATYTLAIKSNAKELIFKIYLSGVGFIDNEKNDMPDWLIEILGQAFGTGPEGGKVTIREAGTKLMDLLKYNEVGKNDTVLIDIFGFSRGAALARHFANVILAGLPDYTSSYDYGLDKINVEMNRFLPKENVKIRFMGLFDTVGSFYMPGNNKEGSFNLSVSDNSNLETVYHIVAANEYRQFFPLTSILSSNESGNKDRIEIKIPGAHGDIGGGCGLLERDYLLLERKKYDVKSDGYKKELYIPGFVKGMITPSIENILFTRMMPTYLIVSAWKKLYKSTVESTKLVLTQEKITESGYSSIPLTMMHKAASDKGVPLREIKENTIPNELRQYGFKPYQTFEIGPEIWEKYIHVSAVDIRPDVKTENGKHPYGICSHDITKVLAFSLPWDFSGTRTVFPNPGAS